MYVDLFLDLLWHIDVCVCQYQYQYSFDYCGLMYVLKSDDVSSNIFFLKIFLEILFCLLFHINFRIFLLISTNEPAGILTGITLNL